MRPQALASEDIHGSGLRYFGRTFEDFVAALVRGLSLHNHPAIAHTRQNHPDEIDVVPNKNNSQTVSSGRNGVAYARSRSG
jgi:hypothetical protein